MVSSVPKNNLFGIRPDSMTIFKLKKSEKHAGVQKEVNLKSD